MSKLRTNAIEAFDAAAIAVKTNMTADAGVTTALQATTATTVVAATSVTAPTVNATTDLQVNGASIIGATPLLT